MIPADDLPNQLEGALILDVRKPHEIAETGTVPGALRIPIDELEARLDELPRDQPYITACNGGGRGKRAAELLAQNGFQVKGSAGLRHYQGPREP